MKLISISLVFLMCIVYTHSTEMMTGQKLNRSMLHSINVNSLDCSNRTTESKDETGIYDVTRADILNRINALHCNASKSNIQSVYPFQTRERLEEIGFFEQKSATSDSIAMIANDSILPMREQLAKLGYVLQCNSQ